MDYIKIANVSDVTEGRVTLVDGKLGRIGLTKVDGEIYAFLDLCTHRDLNLDPDSLNGEIIECAHHGAQFSVKTGEVISMPATEPLETFPVRINGDSIEIGLE